MTVDCHQIAPVTDDYDTRRACFGVLGFDVVAERDAGKFRVASVDTSADFGVYTEVVENHPGFLRQLRAISDTCAGWDGVDPVRIVTRDGCRVPDDSMAGDDARR